MIQRHTLVDISATGTGHAPAMLDAIKASIGQVLPVASITDTTTSNIRNLFVLLDDNRTYLIVRTTAATASATIMQITLHNSQAAAANIQTTGAPMPNVTFYSTAAARSRFKLDVVTNGTFWQFISTNLDNITTIHPYFVCKPAFLDGANPTYSYYGTLAVNATDLVVPLYEPGTSTAYLEIMGATLPMSRVDEPQPKVLRYSPPLIRTSNLAYWADLDNVYVSSPVFSTLGEPADAADRSVLVDGTPFWTLRPSEATGSFSLIAA